MRLAVEVALRHGLDCSVSAAQAEMTAKSKPCREAAIAINARPMVEIVAASVQIESTGAATSIVSDRGNPTHRRSTSSHR
jgi:hypothetical protein